MSFVTSIISTIASIGSTLFHIGSKVVNNVGPIISNVASTVADIASKVSGFIKSGLGTAFDSLINFSRGIFWNIDTFINSSAQFLSGAIKPIHDFVSNISDFVNKLNSNLIEPIRSLSTNILSAVHVFSGQIAADVHQGILGFLKIPGDLADALTSVDAQFGRAMQQLGHFNRQTADESLVPGLAGPISDGFKALVAQFQAVEPATTLPVGALSNVNLSEPGQSDIMRKLVAQWEASLKDLPGVVGTVFNLMWHSFQNLLALTATTEPALAEARQSANEALPVTTLSMGDVVTALYRGIISQDAANTEALREGLSTDRLKVLIENAAWLPSLRENLFMLWREMITETDALVVAKQHGLNESDWKILQASTQSPPRVGDAINMAQRRTAAAAGHLASSYSQDAPEGVARAALENGERSDTANTAWVNHWRSPDMQWWMTAHARGLVPLSDVYQAAEAQGIPSEVIPNLYPVYTEVVQLWMIPDILAAGLMTDQEATQYLAYLGVGDRDAKVILDWGKSKQSAPVAAQAADLSKISATQARDMFNAAIINQDEYQSILIEHGYSATAAELTVALDAQNQAIADRKATAQGLVNEFKAGQITKDDAVAQLYTLGYSTPEVDKYANEMKAASTANARLPSESQLDAMLGAGILSRSDWGTAMVALGFSPKWVVSLYELWVNKNGEPPNPT